MKRLNSLHVQVVVIFFCLLSSFAVSAKEYQLTLLHTNDHHGHFQKFSPYPDQDVGGLAAQSTLVNIIRAKVEKEGGHVLLLSAGDVNTGVPESDLLNAEPDIKSMNIINYDAMTLGNHEFDKAVSVLTKQSEMAKFPFLAANVVRKDSGETLFTPYVIKEIDGLRVAIFGLVTADVPTLVLPENVQELQFLSVIDTARKLVPLLKEKADVVIALTHIGLYDQDSDKTGDTQLAQAVTGIDVIVGGHTHTALDKPIIVGRTLIVQAGAYSEKVGRLNLTVDSEKDMVINYSFELLSVNEKNKVSYNGKDYYSYSSSGYVEDKEILETMEPYLKGADVLLGKPIGDALVELTGGKGESRSRETNLGNLITDSMLVKSGAEIALQNGGSIRAGIAPGIITYRDVLTVQPFGNTLTRIDMTGAQIMEVLNAAAGKVGSGGFLHVAGLKVTYSKGAGKALNVMTGNVPLDLQKTYRVVTNTFLASGGDGYDMLKPLAKYDTGFVDADAMVEYIQKIGKVAPQVEGRITLVE